jgi:hypothetical protein
MADDDSPPSLTPEDRAIIARGVFVLVCFAVFAGAFLLSTCSPPAADKPPQFAPEFALGGIAKGLLASLGYVIAGAISVRILAWLREWASSESKPELGEAEKLSIAAAWPVTLPCGGFVYTFLILIRVLF